jgi:hypothetical protein
MTADQTHPNTTRCAAGDKGERLGGFRERLRVFGKAGGGKLRNLRTKLFGVRE